jgi:hypothetical protein
MRSSVKTTLVALRWKVVQRHSISLSSLPALLPPMRKGFTMRHTELYRQQHAAILELLHQLETNLTPVKLKEDSTEAWRILGDLSGKIVVHLAGEDRWLYPELRSCGDVGAENMATSFAAEMGHIAERFKAYATQWLAPNAMRDEPQQFIDETREIARTLHDRMRREHTELYALADRLHSKASQ